MSTAIDPILAADAIPPTGEFYLLPQEILTDEFFNVRRFSDASEAEAKKIEQLAATIKRDGQIDAAVVTILTDGYVMVSGHRRRRAVILINEELAAQNKPLLRLRVRLDIEGDLKRKALLANIQRENLSPMDLALEIKVIRERESWVGYKGTKKIADYLGISPAQVTQHEKFLDAGKDIQNALNDGLLSVQAAHDLLNVPAESREKVLEDAKVNQEAADRRLTPRAQKKREDKGEAVDIDTPREQLATPSPAKIERPALVKSIRENTPEVVLPRNKKELLEILDSFDSPAYGYGDGAVRTWVRYFVDQIALGKGTVATMRKKFDAMVAKASKGTKPKPEPKKPEAKSAKKKTVESKVKAKKKAATKKAAPKKKKAI